MMLFPKQATHGTPTLPVQVDTMVSMLSAGMSVARVDLTWGSVEYHKRSLNNLQTVSSV